MKIMGYKREFIKSCNREMKLTTLKRKPQLIKKDKNGKNIFRFYKRFLKKSPLIKIPFSEMRPMNELVKEILK